MADAFGRIFLHGLESSGQGFKARLLRGLFPDMLTPDFDGPLEARMAQLTPILATKSNWIIVGSSFGGLMAARFTCGHPHQVQKLVLLAPALTRPDFAEVAPVSVPVIIYHGRRDTVIPLALTRTRAERAFRTLTFHVVDDDHMLRKTVQSIDWHTLLSG